MREAMLTPQVKRLLKASLGVLVVIAFVPLSGAVEKQASWSSGIAAMAAKVVNAGLSEKGTVDEEGYGEIEVEDLALMAGAKTGSSSIPVVFRQECLGLNNAYDLMASEDENLVGFSVDGDAEQVFCQISEELAENGWNIASSGQSTCATFLKDRGEYSWLLVSCIEVSDSTSVVIQCTRRNG